MNYQRYEFTSTDLEKLNDVVVGSVGGNSFKSNGRERNYKFCPFCNGGNSNDTYSFFVNTETGQYQCKRTSCGAHGNYLTFAKAFNIPLTDKSELVYLREHLYPASDGRPEFKKIIFWDTEKKKKTAKWFHREGSAWKNGRNRSKAPLYNETVLPEAGDSVVFIVEGEKDTETLKRLGYSAVSLPDGADTPWIDEYTKKLTGKTVCIIPDNDEAGHKIADITYRNLKDVAAVFLLDLVSVWKGIPKKSDITDYYEVFGENSTLRILDEALENPRKYAPFNSSADVCDPEPEKGEPISDKRPDLNEDDFFSAFTTVDQIEQKEPEWIVQNLIPKGAITLLASDGGVGKTSAWCNLLAALSSGNRCMFDDSDFEGREPIKVAYLSSEDSTKYQLKRRLTDAGANERNIITFDETRGDVLSVLKIGSQYMEMFIDRFRPAMVVFDPLQGFLSAKLNMGSRNEMRDAMQSLMALAEKYGTTFLVVCHANKRKGASGRERLADSADLWDAARSVLMAGFTGEGDTRYISHEKSNYAPPVRTYLYRVVDKAQIETTGRTWKKDRDYMADRASGRPMSFSAEDLQDEIVSLLSNGEMRISEVDQALLEKGYSQNAIRTAKNTMKDSGSIQMRCTGFGSNKVWFIKLSEIINDDPFTLISDNDPKFRDDPFTVGNDENRK